MKNIVTTTALMLLGLCINAQNLQLERGIDKREVPPGHFLQLSLVNDNIVTPDFECGQIDISGTLISVQKDSITLSLSSFDNYISVQNTKVRNYLVYPTNPQTYTIPKSNITALTSYRSEKQIRKKEGKGILAGVLIMSGVISGVTYLFTKEKSSNEHIIIAAGAMIGIGIPLGISSTHQTHEIDNVKKNSWIIK